MGSPGVAETVYSLIVARNKLSAVKNEKTKIFELIDRV